MLQLKSESCQLQNSLLPRESQSFVLFRPSIDWMRPTHIMERKFKCFIQFKCSCHPKTLSEKHSEYCSSTYRSTMALPSGKINQNSILLRQITRMYQIKEECVLSLSIQKTPRVLCTELSCPSCPLQEPPGNNIHPCHPASVITAPCPVDHLGAQERLHTSSSRPLLNELSRHTSVRGLAATQSN